MLLLNHYQELFLKLLDIDYQEQLLTHCPEALEACSVDGIEENQIIDRPKENVKIMDIPSSNTNTSLVVSIESSKINKNES